MDKQELIDKAVEDWSGIFKPQYDYVTMFSGGDAYNASTNRYSDWIFNVHEFEQRAKELGWINGYLWGKEYPTNGKKPDLPDDVLVEILDCGRWLNASFSVSSWNFKSDFHIKFRIVDERYKPVESATSNEVEQVQADSDIDGYALLDWLDGLNDAEMVWFVKTDEAKALSKLLISRKADKERRLLIEVIMSAGNLSEGMLADAILSAGFTNKKDNK